MIFIPKNNCKDVLKLVQNLISKVAEEKSFFNDPPNSTSKKSISKIDFIDDLNKELCNIESILKDENDSRLTRLVKVFIIYDTISKSEQIRKSYTEETLISISKELVNNLEKNKTTLYSNTYSNAISIETIIDDLIAIYNYPRECISLILEAILQVSQNEIKSNESQNESIFMCSGNLYVGFAKIGSQIENLNLK